MTTVYLSIAFFTLAASVGFYLLSFVLKGTNPPKAVAFIHGPLAVTGLILLIVHCLTMGHGYSVPLVLFSLAAVGGLMMIGMHLSGKLIPRWLALGHGLLAVIAFVSLLIATF